MSATTALNAVVFVVAWRRRHATGGHDFALGMLADPLVMAPVLSQPSIPFSLSASHRAALQLSDAELTRLDPE